MLVWLVGQFYRDATWLTGLCFYIPTPFVAAMLLAVMLHAVVRHRRRMAIATAALALPLVLVTAFVENRPFASRPDASAAEFRVVHWNVSGRLRSPGAIDVLVAQRPDLVVLSEAGSKTGIEALQTALGEGGQSLHFAGLAVLSKDPLRLGVTLLEQRRTMVRLVDWDRPEGTVRLMVVDLPSELSVPRDPLLQKINRLIEEHQPDLVIGDFNAPRRSRAFSQLPAGYRHAFESAGQGCGYTWPILVPMLAIDHCLHGPRIVPVRYELRTSLSSDHRLQVFDAAIRP
jgi:endonuclease/exonuclease/phosphatase (EEP) superfamily protein YafD